MAFHGYNSLFHSGKRIFEKQGAIVILCILPWHFGLYLGISSHSLVIPAFHCDYGLLMPLFCYFKGRNVLLLLGEYSATRHSLHFTLAFWPLPWNFFPLSCYSSVSLWLWAVNAIILLFQRKECSIAFGGIFSHPSTISVFKCMPGSIFPFPFKLHGSKSVFQNHFLFVLRLLWRQLCHNYLSN